MRMQPRIVLELLLHLHTDVLQKLDQAKAARLTAAVRGGGQLGASSQGHCKGKAVRDKSL